MKVVLAIKALHLSEGCKDRLSINKNKQKKEEKISQLFLKLNKEEEHKKSCK
ncbi:hypothetical protein NEOC95_000889 [Neochlamydia sp. AcF95]|nr:hypothetical protein [Neochlamydia sp. AcF95]